MSIIKNIGKKVVFSLPSSYVLMFHHVTSTPEIKCSGCMLDTDKFYNIVNLLSNFESLEIALKSPHKRKIVITFDDGLADLYTIAYPYLVSRNIPFTAFIITDFLDKPGYISTEQLIEMSKNPLVTIGSHGLSHEIFTKMDNTTKINELKDSKKKLEDVINKKVNVFAYSHGQYDTETLKYTAEYYTYAMSVKEFPLNFITNNKMLIPRINIDNMTYERQLNVIKN